MHQLQVIRDTQAISAADLTWEQYIYCGLASPGMYFFILCLSLMTSDKAHGSLLTARFRTRLLLAHAHVSISHVILKLLKTIHDCLIHIFVETIAYLYFEKMKSKCAMIRPPKAIINKFDFFLFLKMC